MSRKFQVVMLFLLSLSLGCTIPNPWDNSIKIGINIEQTGIYHDYGNSYLQGVQLAIKKINEKGGIGGKQIKAILADNKSDPTIAADNVNYLVGKKAIALIGSSVTVTNLAAAPAADKQKVVFITSSPISKVTNNQGKSRPFVYSSAYDEKTQSAALATYIRRKLKNRHAFVYYKDGDIYGQVLSENFRKSFQSIGGTAKVSCFKSSDDFSKATGVFKTEGFDVLLLPVYYPDAGMLIKLFRSQGIDKPIVGTDSWDVAALQQMSGREGWQNLYFTTQAYLSKNGHRAQVFIREYQEAYQTYPDLNAALGYDNTLLLLEAVKKAGSEEPAAINKALNEIRNFTGVEGEISFSTGHNGTGNAVVLSYQADNKVLKGVIYPPE